MYSKEQVAKILLGARGPGGVRLQSRDDGGSWGLVSGMEKLAVNIGQNECSTYAQHASAIEFWRVALSLSPKEVAFDRTFAQAEITRHQAALELLNPNPEQSPPPVV